MNSSRRVLRRAAFAALRGATWVKGERTSNFILMYHGHRPWSISAVDPAESERQMVHIKDHFRVALLSDLPGLVAEGVDRVVCLTFDDGLVDNYEVSLAVLENLGLKGTFFLIPGLLGRVLSTRLGDQPLLNATQAKEITALGHEIGAHTMTHPRLANCPLDVARREIAESKHALEDLLGQEITSFAYPYGSCSPEVRELVREAGFRLAVGTLEGHVAQEPNWLELPRVAAVSGDLFRMKVSPAWVSYMRLRERVIRRPIDPVSEWDRDGLGGGVERGPRSQLSDRPAGRKLPVFSVVIPSYNSEATLGLALRSVLQQTFGDFEVVVVDDGSTDATGDLVESIADERIQLVVQAHRGESAARNLGIARSRGEFVAFLDSDDQVFPHWLEQFAQLASAGADILRCGGVRLGPDGLVREVTFPGDSNSIASWLAGFLAGTYVVRRTVLDAVGGIADELSFGQHSELAMRLWPSVEKGRAATAYVIGLRISWSGGDSRYGLARTQSTEYILGHHEALLRSERRFRAACLATAGVSAARAGQMGQARVAFARAVLAEPWSGKALARLAISVCVPRANSFWQGRARRSENGSANTVASGTANLPVRDGRSSMVTVAIPYHASTQVLEQRLEELSAQTFDGDWEIVVANHGSTIGLGAVVDEWRGRLPEIRIVDVGEHPALARARNAAVAASRGDFIAICYADLVVQPGWLESVVAASANADIVGVPNEADHYEMRSAEAETKPYPAGLRPLPDSLRLASGRISGVWCGAWESIGGWSASSTSMEDLEFGLRAELAGYSVAFPAVSATLPSRPGASGS